MPVPPSSAVPVRLTCTGAADAGNAARLRRVLQSWLQEVTESSVETSHIVLGVYEALANCAEHAYRTSPAGGTMKMQVSYDADAQSLSVCVSDRGSWRTPSWHRFDDSQASRGITLMHALADHCTVTTRRDGTTVCLDYSIAPQPRGDGSTQGATPGRGRRSTNCGCHFIAV
jgi:anti-sigma regulatory factor (Ser/Thr protein kinase)